jgi:hypothetical protein
MRSHLEQVRDAFSSCESRNFALLGASWLAASTRAGLGWGATQGIGCSVLTWTVLRRRAGREKQSRRHASVGRRGVFAIVMRPWGCPMLRCRNDFPQSNTAFR